MLVEKLNGFPFYDLVDVVLLGEGLQEVRSLNVKESLKWKEGRGRTLWTSAMLIVSTRLSSTFCKYGLVKEEGM